MDCGRKGRTMRSAATPSTRSPISPRTARRAIRARSRSPIDRAPCGTRRRRSCTRGHRRAFSASSMARDWRAMASRARHRQRGAREALGVRTGVAPSRVHVSPRVGFSYTYNRDRENGQRHQSELPRSILSDANRNLPRRHWRVPRPAAAWTSRRRFGVERTARRDADAVVHRQRRSAARLVQLRRGSEPDAVSRRQRRARRASAVGHADRSGL